MHNQSCSSLQKNMRDCVVTIIRRPQEKGKIVPDLLTKCTLQSQICLNCNSYDDSNLCIITVCN